MGAGTAPAAAPPGGRGSGKAGGRIKKKRQSRFFQLVEKPLGARGPQPPEAIIGFGDMRVKSAKSLA